ncbi:MAG: Tfp pilus assembly protein FimT/FimU [Planctomycetaceae bacterium]
MQVTSTVRFTETDRRCGYTLIEMLIVCAVLAALAGMSWPAMRSVLGKGRLQQGADELQTTLRKARLQAIRTGIPIVFQFEPGGRKYRVVAWNAWNREESHDQRPVDAVLGGGPIEQSAPTISRIAKELPEGVRFESADSETSVLDVAEEVLNVEAPVDSPDLLTEPDWAVPIPFQANGRSENTTIRLIDDRRFIIDVALRGLTGIVTASAASRLRDDREQLTLSAEEGILGDSVGDEGPP